MTSFVRQLNMYNFHKKKSPPAIQIYQHDLFQKGKRHLLKNIKRKSSDATMEFFKPRSLRSGKNGTSSDCQAIRKMNDDAYFKIQSLESRIHQLNEENEKLARRYSEKQKREEVIKSLFSEICNSDPSKSSILAQLKSKASSLPPSRNMTIETANHPKPINRESNFSMELRSIERRRPYNFREESFQFAPKTRLHYNEILSGENQNLKPLQKPDLRKRAIENENEIGNQDFLFGETESKMNQTYNLLEEKQIGTDYPAIMEDRS